MNQCVETEEGVHPSETPLCGQHDNQTKAQRKPDFSESPFSDSKKKVATADHYSVLSSDSCRKKQKMNPPTTQELGVGSSAGMETMSTHLSMAAPQVVCCPVWLGSPRRLGSGGSPSSYSEKDITRSDDDSVLSPASRISQGSPASSGYRRVSNQSKRSTDRDIDFKKKCMLAMNQCEETEEGVHPSETPLCGQHDNQTKALRLGSGGSPSSYSEKDITRSDDDSVLSPASRISQGSPASSGYRRVSNQSKRSIHRDFDFKKKCMLAMNQCVETEEGVHPSETPLCGQHDNQTKALRRLDFSDSLLSHPLKKVATADGDSLWSVDSCRKKQKMNPPTTQELGVGSSAGMETMSTHLSMAAPQVVCCPVWLGSPRRLGSGGSPSSYSEKDITRSDDDSVLSPASRISQGSPASSGYRRVSNQSKRSTDRDIDFKKKCMLAMNQCVETEEGVHPSETPLCGQHDNQTKALSQLDSLLKSIEEAADDDVSVLSSDSWEEEKDKLLHHPGACCWK